MIEVDTIVQGDCLEVMNTFPDKSINCCITSPPYWGLRDYGIEPLIWDGDPECEHTFDSDNAYHDNLRYRVGYNTSVGNNINPKIYTILHRGSTKSNVQNKSSITNGTSESQFCLKCNAWRGSLGLEPTMDMYISHLCSIFDEVKRVLRDDGTLWVNLGDTYASNGSQETRFWYSDNPGKHKFNGDGELSKGYSGRCRTSEVPSKSLCMIPFRFAIEMVNRGWILRNDIIWHKPNCMPSSAKDRFTVDFEHVFFFTKSKRYYFEQQFEPIKMDSIMRARRGVDESNKYNQEKYQPLGVCMPTMSKPREFIGYDGVNNEYENHQGRNKRAVWSITTKGFSEAHFATFPETLIEPMVKAGCPEGGLVYDPFMGAGTVAVVAKRLNRRYIGSELKAEYIEMANRRIGKEIPQMEFSLAGG